MDPIKEAFQKIKEEIFFLKEEIIALNNKIDNIQTTPTHNNPLKDIPTHQQTHLQTTPTHNYAVQPLYNQNTPISTGNEGVPTNTPTHQQTHQSLDFKEINEIIDSLDSIKKEIRKKFKRLTSQEMLVFSTLYNLEDQQNIEITYKIIANQLNLSESSIRDYINKLINKGIPINKTRQNNKIILLNISKDLKNITNLTTIQKLRNI